MQVLGRAGTLSRSPGDTIPQMLKRYSPDEIRDRLESAGLEPGVYRRLAYAIVSERPDCGRALGTYTAGPRAFA